MQDIDAAIQWYLNPRSRLDRIWFNAIIGVAFIPQMAASLLGWVEFGSQAAAHFQEIKQQQDPLAILNGMQAILAQPEAAAGGLTWAQVWLVVGYVVFLLAAELRRRDLKWGYWTLAALFSPLGIQLLGAFGVSVGYTLNLLAYVAAFGFGLAYSLLPSAPKTTPAPWENIPPPTHP